MMIPDQNDEIGEQERAIEKNKTNPENKARTKRMKQD